MRRLISMSVFGFFLFVTTLVGQQQVVSKNRRDGFWFQAGLGGGSLTVSCDIQGSVECSEEAELSGIARVAFGGRLSSAVHLGVSVDVWAKNANDVNVSYGAAFLLVMIYPSPQNGFWINFGPGHSMYDEDAPGAVLKVESFSVVGGLGYDIRVGNMLSLTPFVDVLFSTPGETKLNGTRLPDSDVSVRMFGLGVAITVH